MNQNEIPVRIEFAIVEAVVISARSPNVGTSSRALRHHHRVVKKSFWNGNCSRFG